MLNIGSEMLPIHPAKYVRRSGASVGQDREPVSSD